jgi:type VI protein secretion system component VasF
MRLEQKKDEELAARKGMTGKTIITFIWLIISGVAAYFLITYLIDQDYLSLSIFYQLGVPRAVPDWVFFALLILAVVLFMQFFLLFGFMLASPEGRRHTGDPSLHSHSKDPFEDYGGRG